MLDQKGFDLWADGYDRSVGLSDEEHTYPFAGYKQVLGEIYARVMRSGAQRVLDLGFGTGVLTTRLYNQRLTIHGQDFSPRMIALAQPKMPDAKLYCGDFSQGLHPSLLMQQYDAIIATYALHHLSDAEKLPFLRALLPLLSDSGRIYIGDVAFLNRSELADCRIRFAEDWDDDEYYFVYDDLAPLLPASTFTPCSFCAGIIEIAG